ncbi:uncharacterized protein Z520_00115 [Fonsecaea multimorphosa CBS 102226]|uniref:Altered inheritance of mitochondria protein 21 n=1 Tax=Fonsecaea multimorphosa CBS 102226 TaxID=1442371 RepID=A0A0D2L328_9EURO|nr:uncharacterized protein Z520_00115 [Fonsecaea multimorphosa CBS 102226]KIY03424.1 hypothetical protein Z520_00115 [Fonsecaea multimorphosa CBS 102226]OAL33073.1 hypothetical protein AYO22_00158 [Fonsecaea multimorphosa]
MSAAQVAPTIPPRPVRAQQAAAHGAGRLPDIPPRPINKRLERSLSPSHYPRSPLNEPWSANLTRHKTNEQASAEGLPRRPSVQYLPSLGQEGMEYAEIMDMESEMQTDTQTSQQPPISTLAADAAAQTRNIAQDLQLHAPKPSLPKSSATAQVQAVTRTDLQQASSHGLGKPSTPSQDEGEGLQQVRTRSSFSRPSSTIGGERRPSVFGDEESGPAELGLRVPINPLLGDVQAPSPALGLSPAHTGTNGDKRRPTHSRAKASREIFTPPGSYGLHGHGVAPQDRFEKDWYAKHPEVAQIEETLGHGVYESIGSGRGAFALSSDDLNKIVRDTASRGSGFGTTGTTFSYPDEQIGYLASDIYVSRSQQNTPNSLAKTLTNTSQPALESPLRKASFPANDTIPAEVRRGRLSVSSRHDDHDAVESEQEGEIHIPAGRRFNKITGGEESMNESLETRPLVPQSSQEEEYLQEYGYTAPILAADEVAKEAGWEHLQPAVSPKQERRGSLEPASGEVTPGSRPPSRPTSMYSLHSANHSLSRFISHAEERDTMHTPLEDVHEYEPLFPEDDDKKPISYSERFKQRPNALQRRFPSQDIWEDTPSSALYSATVSTPDLPAKAEEGVSASKTFEPPEQEAARKEEPSEQEKARLIPKEQRLAQSRFAPHLRDDMPTRPGMVPRFPSQDIWEDSPDSHHLVTTISNLPKEEQPEPETSPEVPAKPSIPPRPAKNRLGEGTSSAQVAPSVPPRPQKALGTVPPLGVPQSDAAKPKDTSPTELKKVPSIPDRPKPQIPARPAKKLAGEGLAKTISGGSTGSVEQERISPPVAKAKPQVPARPIPGSKIANLRGNFMNDLNQKLGLGPPKEKEPEPEPVAEEAKPLEDARKGRARGPQRRAPAKSPAAPVKPMGFSMFSPRALWTIDDVDELNVTSSETTAPASTLKEEESGNLDVSGEKAEQLEDSAPAEEPSPATIDVTDHAETKPTVPETKVESQPAPMATNLATNTAGELADPDPTLGTPTQEKSNPLSRNESDEKDDKEGEEVGLSQRTTASSTQASGSELEREEPNPNTDAIPVSKHTTASTLGDTVPLEKSPTPDEPRTLRNTLPEGEPGNTMRNTLPEGEPGKASMEEV